MTIIDDELALFFVIQIYSDFVLTQELISCNSQNVRKAFSFL